MAKHSSLGPLALVVVAATCSLFVACSDDGIYINRSPGSVVGHNTLLDTAGIDVRYPETLATIAGNLVDGPIRARDGGLLWQNDNVSTGIWALFGAQHPVRAVFADPARLDLKWRNAPPNGVGGEAAADLCHAPRGALSPPGAFADFSNCLVGP